MIKVTNWLCSECTRTCMFSFKSSVYWINIFLYWNINLYYFHFFSNPFLFFQLLLSIIKKILLINIVIEKNGKCQAFFFSYKLLGHLRVFWTIFDMSSRVLHFKFQIVKHQNSNLILKSSAIYSLSLNASCSIQKKIVLRYAILNFPLRQYPYLLLLAGSAT